MLPLSHGSAAAIIALALAIGLLIGFEREWSNKDAGIRTCALTALAGAMAALVSTGLAIAGLAAVLVLITFVNLRSLRADDRVEITTSAALVLVYVLGVLVGRGEFFTPVTAAIAATLLLAWKVELHRFAGALRPAEVRGAVWMGLIAFVIYPLLPDRTVDRWGLINPHTVWVAVIVVAAVGFANYVLMRLYSSRGLYYGALLGGLVSSTATVLELGASLKRMVHALPRLESAARLVAMSVTISLLASLAMFARNLILLALFAPQAVASAWAPMLAMAVVAAVLVFRRRQRTAPDGEALQLESPISLRYVFEFGALFLLIQIASTLGERAWGTGGTYVVAILGGIVNSASATAAVGEMAAHHTLAPSAAGVATVLASMPSALINALLMSRVVRERLVGWRNEAFAGLLVLTGALVLAAQQLHF